jgi:hypothetical protein
VFLERVTVTGLAVQHGDWILARDDPADFQAASFLTHTTVHAVGTKGLRLVCTRWGKGDEGALPLFEAGFWYASTELSSCWVGIVSGDRQAE